MENQTTPWLEIKGNSDERLQKAIRAIDDLLFEPVIAGKK